MIVANVTGGFANQLFRYACAYGLAKKFNQELCIIVADKNNYIDAYLLEQLNIPIHKKIILHSNKTEEALKLYFKTEKIYCITEKNYDSVDAELFKHYDIVYTDSAFQRKKFYMHNIWDLRKMYQLKNPSHSIKYFQKIIADQTCVAVHIRRCDFVYHHKANKQFSYDYNESFYLAAIEYLEKILENPIFYVFSDDIAFSKQLLGYRRNLNFVNILGGKNSDIEEFFCISLCHHRILTAGSSFGRMADVLNSDPNKITVYSGNRKEEDNIIYLSDRMIKKYSEEYYHDINFSSNNISSINLPVDIFSKAVASKQELCMFPHYFFDFGNYTQEQEHKLLFLKGTAEYDNGDYENAELTFKRLWQFYYGKEQFHYYYFLILQQLKKYNESIIEATQYVNITSNSSKILCDLNSEQKDLFNLFISSPKRHFVIAPAESYKNAELNFLRNLGFLLKRMGHKVSFIFQEASDWEDTAEVQNYILQNYYMYTDCEDFLFHCRMYDFDKLMTQYTEEEFINELSDKEEIILISRNANLIKKAKQYKNTCTIFMDFSNPYDVEYPLAYQSSILQELYKYSDIAITQNKDIYYRLLQNYDCTKIKFFAGKNIKSFSVFQDELSLSELYAYHIDLFHFIYFLFKECLDRLEETL